MYVIPPTGQLSGPKGEDLFLSIKRALHMPCTGDRWSLMLQLTSNLASVIIKPSFLDVTLCSQQTPPSEENPIFLTEENKMRFLGHVRTCVLGCWEENGVQRLKVFPNVPLKNGIMLFQLLETGVTYRVTTETHFCFKIGSFIRFFPLLFVLLSCTVGLNFAFYVIQP